MLGCPFCFWGERRKGRIAETTEYKERAQRESGWVEAGEGGFQEVGSSCALAMAMAAMAAVSARRMRGPRVTWVQL